MTATFWIEKERYRSRKIQWRKLGTDTSGIRELEENWTGKSLFPKNLGQVLKLLVQACLMSCLMHIQSKEWWEKAEWHQPEHHRAAVQRCWWLMNAEIMPVKQGACWSEGSPPEDIHTALPRSPPEDIHAALPRSPPEDIHAALWAVEREVLW